MKQILKNIIQIDKYEPFGAGIRRITVGGQDGVGLDLVRIGDGALGVEVLLALARSSRQELMAPQRVVREMFLITQHTLRNKNVRLFRLAGVNDGTQAVFPFTSGVVVADNLVQNVLDFVQVIAVDHGGSHGEEREENNGEKHGGLC